MKVFLNISISYNSEFCIAAVHSIQTQQEQFTLWGECKHICVSGNNHFYSVLHAAVRSMHLQFLIIYEHYC